MEKETVTFVLRTTDINSSNTVTDYFNATIVNNIGKIAQNRTSLTWYNVNLKSILGSMYDKYEKFNIYLNFIAGSSTGTTDETTLNYRLFQVNVSGLPFINNNSVIMTIADVPYTADTPWRHTTLNQIPFTINKTPMTTINIDLLTVVDNLYYVPTVNTEMIGQTLYSFSIVGINEYINDKVKSDIDVTINRLEIEKKNKIFY
jgi:hypothetical protein